MPPESKQSLPNPIWGLLWKINQIAVPLISAWGIWVTVSIFGLTSWKSQGGRFTEVDGLQLKVELMERIAVLDQAHQKRMDAIVETISHMPPQDWRDKISEMEILVKSNSNSLIRIETKLETTR